MEYAPADEAADMGSEFVTNDAFWESVCLAFGDIDLAEFAADHQVDYSAITEAEAATPTN